jgi:folate-binding Fe-S cluster repair protein YgfZ
MGINFKKGCYIGQEIIARTHYLGKVKKNIAVIEADNVFKNSDKINNQDNEVVGEVIDDIFSMNKKINLYMIMIREVNRSDSIYINGNQVQLIEI